MTYRTVPRHLPLDVAGDAEPHVVHSVDLEDLGHALNVAMTGSARRGTQSLNVPLVGEMGMPREIVNPHPFDRFLLVPCLAELLDLGLMRAVASADDKMYKWEWETLKKLRVRLKT